MKKINKKDKFNILLTGVGGEGVLTSAVIVARAANLEGYSVRGTFLHGLAQRGGSIPTHVRIGNVHSPWIMQGDADLVLAFEPIEALRSLHYCSRKTKVLIDNYVVKPVYTNLFNEEYPSNAQIEKEMKKFCNWCEIVDASPFAREKFGDPIFGNTVLLGIASGKNLLPFSKKNIREALKTTVPRRLGDNLKAFEIGINWKFE